MTLFNKLENYDIVQPIVSNIRIPALGDKLRHTFVKMNEMDALVEKYGKAGQTQLMLEAFSEINYLKNSKWADEIDELLRLERDAWNNDNVKNYKTTFNHSDNKHYISTTITGGDYIIFGGDKIFVFYALHKRSNELKSVVVRNIGYISLLEEPDSEYEITITLPQITKTEFWLIK